MEHYFPLLLIGVGIFLIIFGVLWLVGSRFFAFGKLPGDIAIEKGDFRFYFPLVTSIILSIVLTLLIWLVQKLLR